MENIYFQPNKENSEFLAKLEKLDEYTIPQILERMVDHFRTLPELEDALNKLGIKTDSLKDEEELDADIRVEERFWVGGKPKKLRHFKGDEKTPILEKEWYQNGQLKSEWGKLEGRKFYIDGTKASGIENGIKKTWYRSGQVCTYIDPKDNKEHFFDQDGNEISQITWSEAGYGQITANFSLRDDKTGEYKGEKLKGIIKEENL